MKQLFVSLFLVLTTTAFSQKTLPSSFVIIENNSNYSIEFITESILKANFESYRNKDERTQLKISNGFTIELLSAKEVFIKNNQLRMENYSNTIKPANLNLELLENGYFIQKVSTTNNPKKKIQKK